MAALAVRLTGITKHYPGVLALDDASFDLRAGEVHILAGENGAGKSTLMKVLAGSVVPDKGTIEIGDRACAFGSPLDALRAGITAVYQEFALCPHLTVAANIFLGREVTRGGFLDKGAMRTRSADLLNRVGAHCGPDTLVSSLGTAQMQLVEIARALNGDFSVLILDEPTAALSEAETAALFRAVRTLKADGKAIAYISHRLEEYEAIGDRVTVMRNGRVVATRDVKEATIPMLVRAMAGKGAGELFPSRTSRIGKPLLRVEHLTQGRRLRDISLTVRSGEIVGVAGLVGSGRTRLLRTIFGLLQPDEGRVLLDGRDLTGQPVHMLIDAGIGLVPEDRKTQGLLLDLSIERNISIANLDKVSRGPFVISAEERALARTQAQAARIKAPSVAVAARMLSGGNQQKVSLAKWLARNCKVLLLDEPARGVDVGARYELFELIGRCAEAGMGVLMVSSYLPEIMGLSDRILVMRRGRIAAEFAARGCTEEAVLHAASVEVSAPLNAVPASLQETNS